MGRLPAHFAKREITFRAPYEMYGEKALESAQKNIPFADSTYMNATDRPFEIHRMIPRCVALDSNDVALSVQPDQELMQALVRIFVLDLGKNNPFMKNATPLDNLVKGTSERTWEFAEPYYLAKGEQITINATADTYPVAAPFADVNSIQVRITFEGFFLTLAPPSENR